jgi:hypothetical protein
MSLDQRYESVRKKLEELHYPHAFGLDSLHLVETLVKELMETKKALGNAKTKIQIDESYRDVSHPKQIISKEEKDDYQKNPSKLNMDEKRKKEPLERIGSPHSNPLLKNIQREEFDSYRKQEGKKKN